MFLFFVRVSTCSLCPCRPIVDFFVPSSSGGEGPTVSAGYRCQTGKQKAGRVCGDIGASCNRINIIDNTHTVKTYPSDAWDQCRIQLERSLCIAWDQI